MTYTINDPHKRATYRSPKHFAEPNLSFTALVPARDEPAVIADTIKALDAITYPYALKETIIICRSDDRETIAAAEKAILTTSSFFRILAVSERELTNKPMALNEGAKIAKSDVIVVFDAEDEPHKDIYHIVNTTMIERSADVVQSGVQLMNERSTWFSKLNVLEYYFWFKSTLHYFARMGAIPLGGNTVFIKRERLLAAGGWDEHCLTEDAELGIRLSADKVKTVVVYDEEHVTREETPLTIQSFIKQRTRWNQGFLQVFLKGEWLQLPKLKQKVLMSYVLLTPFLQTIWILYLPVSLLLTFISKLPMTVTMISLLPLYILLFQAGLLVYGLYRFCKDYQKRFTPMLAIQLLFGFLPYQLMLGYAALRASIRLLQNNVKWEKTEHTNVHRATLEVHI